MQHPGVAGRVLEPRIQQPGEHLAGQEFDILGEEAEQRPDAEVTDRPGVVTTGTQALREIAETPGGGLGEGGRGLARPQALGIAEGPLEQPALAGVAQILQEQAKLGSAKVDEIGYGDL
ncbi:MAG: hypothetical protein MUC79_11590 [Thiobacillaceae bacterium]|nr:hypothetical protein [Thiobacillaceae bacterium]